MRRLRGLLFTKLLVFNTIIGSLWAVVLWPLPHRLAYFFAVRCWAVANLWLLRVLCGVSWEVTGLENLPDRPSVVLMKHSSAFETIAQALLFPRQTWLLKRELMFLPIFGWGLAAMRLRRRGPGPRQPRYSRCHTRRQGAHRRRSLGHRVSGGNAGGARRRGRLRSRGHHDCLRRRLPDRAGGSRFRRFLAQAQRPEDAGDHPGGDWKAHESALRWRSGGYLRRTGMDRDGGAPIKG